jgi:putative membrane protein
MLRRSRGAPQLSGPRSPAARGAGRRRRPGRVQPRDRVPLACLLVFLAVWGALAIAPRYREDWLLENLPVLIGVPIAVLASRRWRFSDRSYVQMTVFLILHSIGAHYTYSEVPIGDWLRDALGWSRNHYDRIVHFLFGVLVLRPVREVAFRGREPRRRATVALSIAAVAAFSVAYEIVEWLTAAIVDPAAGTAFLGTQGDPWDAQKDMALACLGAVLAGLVELRLPGRSRA